MDELELRTEVALAIAPELFGHAGGRAGAAVLARTDGPGAVRTRDVRLGPGGLFVDGERIAATTAIWSADVARRGDGYVLLVRHDTSGKQIAIALPSAREVVAFLARLDGLSRRRFEADILIRPFATKLQRHAAPITAGLTLLIAKLLGVDIGAVLALACLIGVAVLVGHSLFSSRPLVRTGREGVVVGREGIVVQRGAATATDERRFVPFGQIASLEERRRILRFVLQSGELVELRVDDDGEREELRLLVMAGMASADTLKSRGVPPSAAVGPIAGEALSHDRIAELVAQIERQRAGAVGYRGAPLDVDALTRLVADPTAEASRRAMAAALLRGTSEEATERIRVAADAAVEPKVRVALEAAVEDSSTTEAILRHALEEAEEDDAEPGASRRGRGTLK